MRSAATPLPSGEAERDTRLDSETRTVRILLCEDDGPMRVLLAHAMAGRGYEVSECGDGLCLADRLATQLFSSDGERFDVVVSDIRLPGLTGLEILDGLRDEPHPPVVLITAFGDEATHEEARRLGATAVLDKPFEVDALLDLVERVVRDRRVR